VRAAYVPTAKNHIVRDFWRDHGFAETQPGQFALDLRAWTRPGNLPIRITIADGGDAASPTYTPTASHPAAPVTASL
jgi:hypothetical protein